MLENIRLSFAGIWSHKMRSFLTMLGIIIGIASIISIVSTIQGTNEQIKQNLVGAGNNNVDVRLYQGESEFDLSWERPQNVSVISQEQKDQIEKIEGVVSATFYNRRGWVDGIYSKELSLGSGSMYGVDMNFLKTKGYVVQNGRNFVKEDYTGFRKVALVDDAAVQTLFPGENPVGKTLEIQGEPFTVIGSIRKAENFEPVINNMGEYYTYYQGSNGMVLIPQADWPILFSYDEPVEASAMAENTDMMTSIGKKMEDIMNQSVRGAGQTGPKEKDTENSISYKAADLLKTVRNLQQVSENTNNQLIWIAGISLLVGGIGVMNIMLVSVTERTNEIGLKKAIGARKRKILWQFLTEAAVLTSLGGILGVISGLILSQVVSHMSKTPTAVSFPSIILSVVFSMAIGIVFGLLPSVKAANLNPIDALRHE